MHARGAGAPKGSSPKGGAAPRREFLKMTATVPLGLMAARLAEAEAAAQAEGRAREARREEGMLPQIQFGPHSVSRLIVGSNPINGGSHLSVFVNRQMKKYFTEENVIGLLRRCQEVGINTWQSGRHDHTRWRRLRDQGLEMHYICIQSEDPDNPKKVEELAQAGVIGVAHHGETTDNLFKQGKIEQAREYLKKVRDAGMQVGLSTHMPAVIEYVEEKGWDLDYYMACVYERHRSREQLKKLLGYVPIPVREVYLEEDAARMCETIRQTDKTCLAFKILAAGRLCERPEQVRRAFEFTFANIKPNDGVIVGMYPEYSDQAGENAALTREFSSLSRQPQAA
ncbi:MAG: hypothetical protein ACE5R4_03150 [Armatimonadota bacterium]